MLRAERRTARNVAAGNSLDKILVIEAELLRSEGIDPAWPRFPNDQPDDEDEDA
jgi:hypothetical protein